MSKSTIGILVFTLLIVFAWIGFDLYHSSIDTEFKEEYLSIKPADSFLDIDMLDIIDSKQTYDVYNSLQLTVEEEE